MVKSELGVQPGTIKVRNSEITSEFAHTVPLKMRKVVNAYYAARELLGLASGDDKTHWKAGCVPVTHVKFEGNYYQSPVFEDIAGPDVTTLIINEEDLKNIKFDDNPKIDKRKKKKYRSFRQILLANSGKFWEIGDRSSDEEVVYGRLSYEARRIAKEKGCSFETAALLVDDKLKNRLELLVPDEEKRTLLLQLSVSESVEDIEMNKPSVTPQNDPIEDKLPDVIDYDDDMQTDNQGVENDSFAPATSRKNKRNAPRWPSKPVTVFLAGGLVLGAVSGAGLLKKEAIPQIRTAFAGRTFVEEPKTELDRAIRNAKNNVPRYSNPGTLYIVPHDQIDRENERFGTAITPTSTIPTTVPIEVKPDIQKTDSVKVESTKPFEWMSKSMDKCRLIVNEEAPKYGIDPSVALILIQIRSACRPNAAGGVMVLSDIAAQDVGASMQDLQDLRVGIQKGLMFLSKNKKGTIIETVAKLFGQEDAEYLSEMIEGKNSQTNKGMDRFIKNRGYLVTRADEYWRNK